MNTQFIYHLLGNTQASKQPRQLSHTTNPRKLGVWTLPKLAERVVLWAFEEYDLQPHPALSMTPRAAYEQSLEQDGARIHRMIPYDDTFTIATFPTTSKGKALIQPGRGVRINHLDYWCEAMRDPTVEQTSVAVRYDPFDVSVGYVYLKGCWRTCIIAYDELAGCSARELQIIAEEVRKRKRLVQGRTQVEVTQEQLAQFRRDNVATEVVLRQQRKDRETLAAVRALDGHSSATGSPPLASPPVSGQRAPRVEGTSSTKTERPSEDKLLIFRRIR